jgi:ATP phosphoribosyltransferase
VKFFSKKGGRLLVPRGRIFQEFLSFLETRGVYVDRKDGDRRLLLPTSLGWEILITRTDDLPSLLEGRAGSIGVIGLDTLREFSPPLLELYDLQIGSCRLVLAVPENVVFPGTNRKKWRVATRYPRLTEQWFLSRGIPYEVIPLTGAVESSVETGIADCVVDLADTGETLRSHKLKEEEILLPVTSWLVAHPMGFYEEYERILDFMSILIPDFPTPRAFVRE